MDLRNTGTIERYKMMWPNGYSQSLNSKSREKPNCKSDVVGLTVREHVQQSWKDILTVGSPLRRVTLKSINSREGPRMRDPDSDKKTSLFTSYFLPNFYSSLHFCTSIPVLHFIPKSSFK